MRRYFAGLALFLLTLAALPAAQTADGTQWQSSLRRDYFRGLTIREDSRFLTIENQLVHGDVVVEKGVSQLTLRNIRIVGGSLIVKGLNWHNRFENIWVTNSPTHGFIVGGFGPEDNGNGLHFMNCFASFSRGLGWFVVNQTGLTMTSSAADQNAMGGFLFNSVQGTFTTLTAESNYGDGIHFWDSWGLLSSAMVDAFPGQRKIVINGGEMPYHRGFAYPFRGF